MRVLAVNRAAREIGLGPGLTLADARARVPELQAVPMEWAEDESFLEHLGLLCGRYTPLVMVEKPDGLVLDVTGCPHLFGGEAALCADLQRRFTAYGVEVRLSLAGTPDAARALARFSDVVIVPPGGEAAAVQKLPVEALGFEGETTTALKRAGLKTIGDLAERPNAPLAARFGEELTARLRRVRGLEDICITPTRPLPDYAAEQRFAEPIGHLDDIKAVLGDLAQRLVRLLAEHGQGSRQMVADFYRTDGTIRQLSIETGQPVRDPKVMGRLFGERIDTLNDPLDPGFGFDLIRLSVTALEDLQPVQSSLDGNSAAAMEMAELVDRLGVRFGTDAVMRFVPIDSHMPERAVQMAPALAVGAQPLLWTAPEPGMPPARPLHLFEPPQMVDALAEVPDGPPLKFRWRRVLHEVVRAEGPERIAAEWWHEVRPARDYYRIEDAEGLRFWVFREGLYTEAGDVPRWFVHGLFA